MKGMWLSFGALALLAVSGTLQAAKAQGCPADIDSTARNWFSRAQEAEAIMRQQPTLHNLSVVDDMYAKAASEWADCDDANSAKTEAERLRVRDLFEQLVFHPTQPPTDNNKK